MSKKTVNLVNFENNVETSRFSDEINEIFSYFTVIFISNELTRKKMSNNNTNFSHFNNRSNMI